MKNLKKSSIIVTIISFLTLFTSAKADIKVVASIKPIHSLASYLMDGVAKPDLIVDGYASPHGFAMKPSHAKMLQNADIVFWVGEDLENFLEKPLYSIAAKAEKIELSGFSKKFSKSSPTQKTMSAFCSIFACDGFIAKPCGEAYPSTIKSGLATPSIK